MKLLPYLRADYFEPWAYSIFTKLCEVPLKDIRLYTWVYASNLLKRPILIQWQTFCLVCNQLIQGLPYFCNFIVAYKGSNEYFSWYITIKHTLFIIVFDIFIFNALPWTFSCAWSPSYSIILLIVSPTILLCHFEDAFYLYWFPVHPSEIIYYLIWEPHNERFFFFFLRQLLEILVSSNFHKC